MKILWISRFEKEKQSVIWFVGIERCLQINKLTGKDAIGGWLWLAFLKLKMLKESMTARILTCKKRRREYELRLQPIIQKGRGIYQP